MYRSSARLVRHLADKYDVPIDREHILGHVEVPGATHTDPGPGWDWDRYMRYVREAGGPAYAASYVGMDHPDEMRSGESAVASVELKNDGSATWDLDATRLTTSMPTGRASALYAADNWLSESEPAAPITARTAPATSAASRSASRRRPSTK